jgi:perosamine synthetase
MQKDSQFSKVLKIGAERYAPCATCIPYARQWIDEDDIQAVVEVLRSDWLTTGPKVTEFEETFAHYVHATHAVAVSSGTAALHAAMYALGIGPGDEVIVPPITFAATANCVAFQGGTPIFADVEDDTLLLDPVKVEASITPHTKAVIAVDYTGQPCDYDELRSIADRYGLFLVADSCHALGARYKGRKSGTLADLTVFSFHPVKHITTGEGGMITTNDHALAARMRLFINHGITRNPKWFSSLTPDPRPQTSGISWYYEMQDLGYNYRITDVQCALGLSQLKKLPSFLQRRYEIAAKYDEALADIPSIEPLGLRDDVLSAKQSVRKIESLAGKSGFDFASRKSEIENPKSQHAYHLYVVRLALPQLGVDRAEVFRAMRAEGIGVNVHYIPVHLHPFYRKRFGTGPGLCPMAETAYRQIMSLPMFAHMSDVEIEDVITSIRTVAEGYSR